MFNSVVVLLIDVNVSYKYFLTWMCSIDTAYTIICPEHAYGTLLLQCIM